MGKLMDTLARWGGSYARAKGYRQDPEPPAREPLRIATRVCFCGAKFSAILDQCPDCDRRYR